MFTDVSLERNLAQINCSTAKKSHGEPPNLKPQTWDQANVASKLRLAPRPKAVIIELALTHSWTTIRFPTLCEL